MPAARVALAGERVTAATAAGVTVRVATPVRPCMIAWTAVDPTWLAVTTFPTAVATDGSTVVQVAVAVTSAVVASV